MPLNLSQPPVRAPIVSGGYAAGNEWVIWFNQVYNAIMNRPPVLTKQPLGIPPPSPLLGQMAVTSAGYIAYFNGTVWVKYDGTTAVF